MENFHLGKEVVNGEWGDWIDTCLAEPFWDRWEAVPGGVETNLIDTRYSISGKADLIIRHKETGEIAILDYKTQGRKTDKAYCVKTQLGAISPLRINAIQAWLVVALLLALYALEIVKSSPIKPVIV